MDLVQLRYAVKVAETENFSRAAEQCFVTQPTLSQRIHQLEQELGVPLFERSTRRVSLTDAGRLFVAKAQIILADADRLAEEMEGERRRIKGSLSIGVLTTLSHLNIPQYLSSFQQQYPNIAVELELGWSADLMELVSKQKLDVIISNVYLRETDPLRDQLAIHTFLEDYISVLMNPKHPLAGRKRVNLEEFSGMNAMAFNPRSSIQMQVDDLLAQMGTPPKIVCVCSDMDSLVGMVRANMGVAFLSSGIAAEYVQEGLVSVPLVPTQHTHTAMILRSQTAYSYPIKLFADFFWGIRH